MNLKNIKHAKGTGASTATTNGQVLCSPTDAYNYMMTMLQILAAFFLFCYTTTCNYFNALLINTDKDYPVGKTLEGIIQTPNGENPYASRFLKCNTTGVESDKVPKFNWWWQNTQETSYHLGGWILHNYFDFSKDKFIGPTEKIPDTGILSFILWMLFGVWTQLSMLVMLCAVFLTWIPGWFAGLFAFRILNGTGLNKFLLFCLSAALTFVFGLVTVFPIFYEFIYLIYLFFFKRFISDPNKVSDEFTNRMTYLIVVYVIVALIVAAIQLPPITAGAMAIIVAVVSMVSYYITRSSGNKSADTVSAVVGAAVEDK
jgi:hypothetical protein